MNHFVNTIPVRQPTQQQQQQQTMQSGLTERQRQELLMQQRQQQDIIARQQQEQLVRQEQEQRMLQQQFKQLQQQKTPGITTLSARKFAARLPQPMAHMSQVKVLALNATNNQTEIQTIQPVHFEQQGQQKPVQPVPTPVVEASVAQPAPAVQPQQQQQQHPTVQPIQPTQQLIQPFQPIQQQQPQQPQQQVHTPIKPVTTVDQTAPSTTRMNNGVFVDQQRQSPSSKQFNSPSLNKAIEFNRQNMHKTLFQPMIKSIPITKCNVVQCGKKMVCREIRDCPTCSPMCLPQDPTEVNLGHVITCENIKCPYPFKCVKSTFDQSVKCEVA